MGGDVRVYNGVPGVELFVELGPQMPASTPLVIDDTTKSLYAYLSGGVTQVAAAASGSSTASTTVAYGIAYPSCTEGANITEATVLNSGCQYMQVGNVVTMSGAVRMQATLGNTDTHIYMGALPVVASGFVFISDAGGNAGVVGPTNQNRSMGISAVSGQRYLDFFFRVNVSTTSDMSFNVTYIARV